MPLNQIELLQLSKVAIEAATKAGLYLANVNPKELISARKEDQTSLASQVVTNADMRSQEIILEHLRPISKRFNIGLLSEEQIDDQSRFSKEYFWAIDPLDGTYFFLSTGTGHSVVISLINRQGEPVIGVLFDITQKSIYWSDPSAKVFKDKKKWRPSTSHESCLTIFLDHQAADKPEYQQVIESIKKDLSIFEVERLEIISEAGGALNSLRAMLMPPAIYFKIPKKQSGGGHIWDFASSYHWVKLAGGHFSGWNNHCLNFNRKNQTSFNDTGIVVASSVKLAEIFFQKISKKHND
jgi:3'-phosphoadenosine 5'-phosphosulfate (PAPS) 3'-phosphatase